MTYSAPGSAIGVNVDGIRVRVSIRVESTDLRTDLLAGPGLLASMTLSSLDAQRLASRLMSAAAAIPSDVPTTVGPREEASS